MDAPHNTAPASDTPPSKSVMDQLRQPSAWQILLALILALAIGLRLFGLSWDDGFGHTPHPDERAILGKVLQLAPPALGDLGTLFDAERSGWNPRWFNYGSFPLYLLRIIHAVDNTLLGGGGGDIRPLARAVSAAADIATVLAVFGVGALAFDRRTGLLAAALTALAVVHIQLSHFFAVDTLQALLAIAALFFMIRVARSGRLQDSAIAGALVALGLATKASQLPIVAPFIVAHLIYLFGFAGNPSGASYQDRLRTTLRGLAAGGGAAFAVFIAAQPYTFLDWGTFYSHVSEQSEMVRGIRDYPYTRQYADTAPYLYHIRQLAVWGYGVPLGIVAWGGLLYASLRGMPLRAGLAYLAIGWGLPIAILLLSQNIIALMAAAGISLLALIATLPLRSEKTRLDVLLLCWVVPYFLITGAFHVKFMRYLLPIAPLLTLFGARMLFALWDAVAARRMTLRPAAGILIALVIGGAALYSLAYLAGIYGSTHTAVRAAEWLNRSAHDDAFILKEHWEEGLPNLKGGFSHFDLPLYEDDNISKTALVAQTLSRADYLVFFSNRLYGTIPRLPQRYPVTTQYYRLLFAGELGYTLENAETAYPQLLGVRLVDDTFARPNLPKPPLPSNGGAAPLTLNLGFADESFSVYDHPKVMIFRNTQRLDAAEIRSRIERAAQIGELGVESDAASGEPYPSSDAAPEIGLVYSPQDSETQRNGDDWREIIYPDWTNRIPVLGWLGIVELIGLLALPLTFVIFRALPDRGYLFAKPLGILLIGLAVWLLASLQWMPFSRGSIGFALGLAALVALGVFAANARDIVGFVRRRWSLLLAAELIFLAAFFAFVLVRMANPDLWHPFRGGEKPMDFAYLNAVLRSAIMPPYDPWFGGGYINYYYWGQFLTALLIRATAIDPTIAFNLAVPTFFALTLGGAYTIVYNLTASARQATAARALNDTGNPIEAPPDRFTRARRMLLSPVTAGIAGAAFVTLLGNLDGAIQVGGSIVDVLTGQPASEFDFWRSSRMMPPDPPGNEITEFPFFTFLFADLHAHLMALPFTLLVVGLALAIALAAAQRRVPDGGANRYAALRRRGIDVLRLAALGVAIGSMSVLNTWDLPTYLIVGAAALLLSECIAHGGLGLAPLFKAGVKTLFAAAVGYAAFLPYHLSYETFYNSVDPTTNTTVLWQFLAISGVSVFIIGSFAIDSLADGARSFGWTLRRWFDNIQDALSGSRSVNIDIGRVMALLLGALLLGFALTAAFTGVVGSTVPFVAVLFLLLGVAAARALFADEPDAPQLGFAAALALIALALVIGLDFWRVEGDIDRLNSIFKFYLQVWALLGIAAAYMLWRLLHSAQSALAKIRSVKKAWLAALAALILCASIYPVLGTRDRLRDRFEGNVTPLTLNGAAFIEKSQYREHYGDMIDLASDYEGIQWLKANVEGSPILLEAVTPTYRWGGRVSLYTGLPTVIGWQWHQEQQRFAYREEVPRRIADVETIYNTADSELALELLRKYDVEYVYLGQLERLYFPDGMDKFDGELGMRLQRVFDNGDTAIYRLPR